MAAHPRAFCGLTAVLAGIGILAGAGPGTLASANAKMERIERDRAPAGSAVVLTAAELLAYANEQARVIAPGALRDTRLTLTPEHAETFTYINFLKVRQAEGHEDGWLAQQLLDGERPVRIRVRFQSAHGRARVDVERVEISGVVVQGTTLDFLLRRFVIPNFPDARAGDWFTLGHRIDRLEVVNGAVRVAIAN